jgi:glycerophosphoryl diester phosphodiesterase
MAVPIISHRGLCRATPRARRSGENLPIAFEAGLDVLARLQFPPAIEFDVRRAADGELVVIHDATLRRVFGVRGRVSRCDFDALSSLGVPRLVDLLQRFPTAECHVEIKERGIAHQVLAAIDATGAVPRTVVSSFLWKEVAPLAGQVRIAFTTAVPTARTVRAAVGAGAWAIHPEQRRTTVRLVDAAHAAGLKVNAWTVNTPRAYARMERLGVDAVFSDNPRFLVAR